MWERFSEHAPTVALASVAAGMISVALEGHAATRKHTPLGCTQLALRAGSSGVLGCGVAGIFAAGIVEHFPESPWLVVFLSVAGGLTVDVTTRAGFRRLFRLVLRLNLSIAKTLSDDESN